MGGYSLATRVIAVAVLPIIALTVLAVQRVRSERASVEAAHSLASLVSFQRAVATVSIPAYAERIVLVGLTKLDDLGVPRQAVVDLSGVNFEDIYATKRAELDLALDGLQRDYGHVQLKDGHHLGPTLVTFHEALRRQRDLSGQHQGSIATISGLFDELDTLLSGAVEDQESELKDRSNSEVVAAAQAEVHTLADVAVAAGERAKAVLDALLNLDRDHMVELAGVDGRYNTLAVELAERMSAADAALLQRVGDLSVIPRALLLGVSADAAAAALDPNIVRMAVQSMSSQIDTLAALVVFIGQIDVGLSEQISAEARQLDRSSRMTITILGLGTLLTIVLGALVTRSVLRPLSRLTRRASAVSDGHLALEPLRPSGPRSTRVLTTAVNDLVGTLALFDRQASALASGDLGAATLRETLPGSLGRSIRESVGNLTAVTQRLTQSEAWASAIVEHAADAIWTVAPDGIICSANTAAEWMVGLSDQEQVGRPLTDFVSVGGTERSVCDVHGVRRTVLIQEVEVPAEPHPVHAVFARDISELKRFEQRLVHQARHDSLTGLSNRFAVLEHLEHVLVEQSTSCAVLFIDIDGFKSVNDSHGHAAGDLVLQEVANRIRAYVREDDLVARLGGDEFLIVMKSTTDHEDASAFGDRVIREIEQPYVHGSHMFAVSASIGVAMASRNTSPMAAIERADAAVYLAKQRGRGRVELFDHDLQASIEHRAEIELALRQAIRNGELDVHFQPVQQMAGEEFWGAEALVRWNRPGIGQVPPNDFIPIAERSALIFELERWVLARACELVVGWRLRDPHCRLRVAVNISGRHLTDGDLVGDLDAVLAETGADPSMLEFELTETQLLEDLDRASEILDRIRARGVTIAVDDFGTGYSSMTYLRRLPVDSIKIDRSFVARAAEHEYDATIVEALLAIGRTLNLDVVAEGIETEEQLDYMRSRGVDRAQGFLLARPMPLAQAEDVIFGSLPMSGS
jgi:diguanylate cyclase (GGDEF)-like protein